ncbi:ATP-binding protein [uncultured Enterovirga sp.]|uniref:sensor histidine kinase n=1 Tax=uncultured Enterovirga sp. TaxID=2026352 RepID=UPI0035CADC0D
MVGSLAAFVSARSASGIVGLASVAACLAVSVATGWTAPLLVVAAAAPCLSAAVASRMGRSAPAYFISGTGFGILAAASAGSSPLGLLPLLLVLLAAEPADALLSNHRRGFLAASVGSMLAFAAVISAALPTDAAASWAAPILILQVAVQAAVSAKLRSQGATVRRPERSSPIEDTVPIAAIGDLVTWHDAFGDVLRASAASGRLLGAAPRALAGGGLLARVHVSDRPIYLKSLSDAANGVEPVRVEFRVHRDRSDEPDQGHASRTSGAVVWVEMRAHPLRRPGHDQAGAAVLAVTRDVSDQRRHAEELETARLEAERANEIKGRFLATVSHELRTPLNAIIGFSELLSADHPFLLTEERRKEYAHIIRGSGHHLLEIVNTLLDMSKIETGNFNFEPEPFGLRELAASTCDLIQLKADEAGVRIERRLDSGLPEIVADRRACRQILINLISNAVKFTPRGGLVTVSLGMADEEVVIGVADTGIGIPETDLPRLGDPFFQSGDVHRRSHEGTGLGLSVVRGLVGLHRGRMSIESGSGAGTTVTVSLPLEAGDDVLPAKPAVVHTLTRLPVRQPERMSA